jgi:hypothetical protein
MKRTSIIAVALVLALSASLYACGGKTPAAEPTPEPTPTFRTKTIGLVSFDISEELLLINSDDSIVSARADYDTGMIILLAQNLGETDSPLLDPDSSLITPEFTAKMWENDSVGKYIEYELADFAETQAIVAKYKTDATQSIVMMFDYGKNLYVITLLASNPLVELRDEWFPLLKESIKFAEQTVKWYPASGYKVGTDIPAGEYYLKATDGSYSSSVGIYSDSGQEDTLEYESFTKSHIITIAGGQFFNIKGCKAVSLSEYTPDAADPAAVSDGMYRVGIDIPAGEYKLTATDDKGFFCVYDNSTAKRKIKKYNSFEGNSYITVSDGQYLDLGDCTGAIVK